VIEPVDPFRRCVFHGFQMPPGTATVNHFGLVESDNRFRPRVVVRVADALGDCIVPRPINLLRIKETLNKSSSSRYYCLRRAEGISVKQMTFAGAKGFAVHGRATRKAEFLARMDALVPWAEFCGLIEPHYPRAGNYPNAPRRSRLLWRGRLLWISWARQTKRA
jgi:hypothetical protein